MTTSPATVTQTSRTFRIECAAAIDIRATPQRIWSLLTNAADFPRWNATVTRITGTIAEGERLALEVAAAPGRTFRPRMTRLEPARLMVWSDGFAPMFKGVRTFALAPASDDDQGLAPGLRPVVPGVCCGSPARSGKGRVMAKVKGRSATPTTTSRGSPT